MSFRTIVIQSEAKNLECISMYTPSSGIQILRRDAPLDDKWRRSEQRNHKSYVIQSEAKDLENIHSLCTRDFSGEPSTTRLHCTSFRSE